MVLQNEREVIKMEWISAKERVPETDKLVLIKHKEGVSLGRFVLGNWYSRQYPKRKLKTACFWLDFPEPPLFYETKVKKQEREERKEARKQYPQNLLCKIWDTKNFEDIKCVGEIEDIKKRVEYKIDTLTERETKILYFRYKDCLTQSNIGELLGVSRERIRQIEQKALRKLRHPSRSIFIKTGEELVR